MDALILLRQMIIDQQEARIDYHIGPHANSLYYNAEGFEGEHDEVVSRLRDILVSDKVSIATSIHSKPITDARLPAVQAVASALNGFQCDAKMRLALIQFAKRLPPLLVRLFPMHRYGFQDNSAYMKMHAIYERDGVLHVAQYLDAADSRDDEMVRLRVIMATYLLGLIAPLDENASSHTERTTASIFNRLLKRITGDS